jgi:ABC-type phosphate transport system substrate-binding protein
MLMSHSLSGGALRAFARRQRLSALGLAVAALGAAALATSAAVPARADYEPGPNDVVGVGSDVAQYALDFGADGDTVGDPGYNSANNEFKLVYFNAVADANGRAAYANGSTEADPIPLNPTIVIRAGTYPIQRPNSSGAGISALIDDTSTSDPTINFAGSASIPTSAQGSGVTGGLHYTQLATDTIALATDSTTNAPTLTIADLLQIYEGNDTTWTQVGGTSTDKIIPELPPSGSSVNKTFIASLTAANGGVAPTLGSDVVTVEQNDPTAITLASTPADAIVPFSVGRLNLWNGVSGAPSTSANSGVGYFHDPTVAYPGSSTALKPGIVVQTGTGAYSDTIDVYAVFPQSAETSTTPWQPGSKLNWVQALFSDPGGPTPWYDTSQGQSDLAQAGLVPDYVDNATPIT